MSPRAIAVVVLSAGLPLGACSSTTTQVESGDAGLGRDGARLLWHGAPFAGALLTHDAEGRLLRRQEYRDGLQDGTDREWYADGHLAAERPYAHGRKVGEHRGWWDDGRPRFLYRFADGEMDGPALNWFENGRLAESHRYARGHEAGPQRTWFEDGRVRASYDYRDGRRYGTIGAKLCIGETRDTDTAAAPAAQSARPGAAS